MIRCRVGKNTLLREITEETEELSDELLNYTAAAYIFQKDRPWDENMKDAEYVVWQWQKDFTTLKVSDAELDVVEDALRLYRAVCQAKLAAAEAPPKRGGAGGRKRGSEWHR